MSAVPSRKSNHTLTVPEIVDCDIFKRIIYTVVDKFHCVDGIGREVDTSVNIADGMRLVVDGDGDAAFVEAAGEDYARDTAADNDDLEVLRGHGGRKGPCFTRKSRKEEHT